MADESIFDDYGGGSDFEVAVSPLGQFCPRPREAISNH